MVAAMLEAPSAPPGGMVKTHSSTKLTFTNAVCQAAVAGGTIDCTVSMTNSLPSQSRASPGSTMICPDLVVTLRPETIPKPCRLRLCRFSFSRKYCCSSSRSSGVINLPEKNRGRVSHCESPIQLQSSSASIARSSKAPTLSIAARKISSSTRPLAAMRRAALSAAS